MAESPQTDFISWENLIYVVDLLQAGGEKRISLLGGEPSLHPDFDAILLYLLERKFSITVFTSGVISEKKLELMARVLKDAPEDRCSFVCNLNDPERTPHASLEVDHVRRFLHHFGPRTVPGFNIYQVDFRLDFVLQLINEFGLRRSIRLGLAHPILGHENRHITLEDMNRIVERLISYQPLFERLRTKPGLDCGFPLCRFGDERLGRIHQTSGWHFNFSCGPVVDIGPDLSVWPCFPLSSCHRKSLFDFNSIGEVVEYYRNFHRVVRVEQGGIYDECDNCKYREEGVCHGGCVVHAMARFQSEAPLRFKEVYG
jgi:cyclic pyranopterin phosphate synthase